MKIERLFEYAAKTGIEIYQTQRFDHSRTLGIPDCRGFSPHLRRVNINLNSPTRPWIAHDILHILFYDYATDALGLELWTDKHRFMECHLASEAFAVQALDYHHLSKSRQGGLTVDIQKGDWNRFQKLNPKLPDLDSEEFCKKHLDFYLTGKNPFSFRKNPSQRYLTWQRHEVSYSIKQRDYVSFWWRDLNGLKASNTSTAIEGSHVWMAVWDLLTLLMGDSRGWKKWTDHMKSQNLKNRFVELAKFNKSQKSYDFRFTSVDAFSTEAINTFLERAKKPGASHLFLFWQWLAKQKAFSKKEADKIKRLAKKSQMSATVPQQAWDDVRQICIDLKSQSNGEVHQIGNFYLA